MTWRANLIKIANAGVHKEVRLTLAMPQEYGAEFIAEFGWPTEDNPITVEVLSAQPTVEDQAGVKPLNAHNHVLEEQPARRQNRLSVRAGILSTNEYFWRYAGVDCQEQAAAFIRSKCGVKSRADILPGTEAETRLNLLESSFVCWRQEPDRRAPRI